MPYWIAEAIAASVFTLLGALIVLIVQHRITSSNDRNSVVFAQQQEKRSEIADELITFYRKTKGAEKREIFKRLEELNLDAKVACWFPDIVYQGFRDHVIAIANEPCPPLPGDYWEETIEHLIQDIVDSVRSKSKLLELPPSPIAIDGQQYRFLPWIKFKEDRSRGMGTAAAPAKQTETLSFQSDNTLTTKHVSWTKR